jgi:DNA invertase Pin-like site-specific DNA recombinase
MKTKPKIGCYLRVSTSDGKQDVRSQRVAVSSWAALNHVPLSEIKWYADRKSGRTTDRPKLKALLRDVGKGVIDTIVVNDLSRLSRSLLDGVKLLADFAQRGIRVVSCSESIDFNSHNGQLVAQIMLAVAEWSRKNTVARIHEGLQAAKKKGQRLGRPRDEARLNEIRKLFDSGVKATEIAERLGCTRANVYLALDKTKESAA